MRKRRVSAQKRSRAAQTRRKPELRISYRKAVEALAAELLRHDCVNPPTEKSASVVAEVWLRPLLTDRQKAAL